MHAAFLSGLLILAVWLPLPLYLLSLAVFGLPHVIWEMGFLRSRYAARWPKRWWYALGAVLLAQAGVRGAVWLGSYPAGLSQIIDLFALMLLALMVVLAPMRCGWRVRSLGLMLAGVIVWLLEQGDILTPLLLLALVHNMTPLAMAWDLARDDVSARPLAWLVSGLFVLPAAIIVWGEGMQAWATAAFVDYAPLLDSQLPTQWGGMRRQAILSAIVLSQCLHYYCVIRLLPNAESQRIGRKVLSPTVKIGTLLASMLLIGYYVIDYSAARKLYAVAAGAHAWLEWPVLLMALLACTDKQPLSTFKHRSVDET